MRTVFLFTFFCITSFVQAQKIEAYYDWKWKICEVANARFLSVIEPSDTLWLRNDYYIRERRLQMKGFYRDKECKIKQGPFLYYYSNGNLESQGSYANDKRIGLWLHYHSNGMMRDSINYDNGKPFGTELKWHPNGIMSDSVIFNSDGRNLRVHWFDNGQLSSAGYEIKKKQNAKWQYFHLNGQLSAEEVYDTGKLVSRVYYSEKGEVINDTADRSRDAECKKNWIEYLTKNLYFPRDVKFVNGDKAVVVVDFIINEEGKVEDAHIYSSFHHLIDDIALKVIKNSPQWIPAIDHNRRVKAYRRQPMTFLQEDDY